MIQTIRPANELFQKLFAALPNKGERRCKYVLTEPCDEGLLLWNTLTLALHLWEGRTADDWEQERFSADDRRELERNWLLVPAQFDEAKTVEQLRCLLRVKEGMPTKYTILTTTACNARCPYCYQRHGRFARASMSDEVARDTVDFILRTNRAEEIHLDWCGGEPLLNTRAIDIICRGLRERGVKFRSFITTNGILFDEEMILKAKEEWKVEGICVTIDGSEKNYIKTKNFRGLEENPYNRIIGIIHRLVDIGLKPKIRMNLTYDNREDVEKASADLYEEFEDTVKYACEIVDYELKSEDEERLSVMLEIRKKNSIAV